MKKMWILGLLLAALLTGCGAPQGDGTAGSFAEGVYTNPYMGASCALGDDWTFQEAGPGRAMLREKSTKAAISVERMQGLELQTADEIIDDLVAQKDEIVAGMLEQKMEEPVVEKTTVTFLGEQIPALRIDSRIKGEGYYSQLICILEADGTRNLLTVETAGADRTGEILGAFTR